VGAGGIGLLLLWLAAWFTIVTGWDYFRKGLPYIREKESIAAKEKAESEG
jgi:CDP-diacylglycerol--glycerol-3-phosphate 3-phosphatidyltransferase